MATTVAGRAVSLRQLDPEEARRMFQTYGCVVLDITYEATTPTDSAWTQRWQQQFGLTLDETMKIWESCTGILQGGRDGWLYKWASMEFGSRLNDRFKFPIPYIYFKHHITLVLRCMGQVMCQFELVSDKYGWKRQVLRRTCFSQSSATVTDELQMDDKYGLLSLNTYYVDPRLFESVNGRMTTQQHQHLNMSPEQFTSTVEKLSSIQLEITAERALTDLSRMPSEHAEPLFAESEVAKQPVWLTVTLPVKVFIKAYKFMECYYSVCKQHEKTSGY